MPSLANATAVIAGASSGIGLATALAFARRGANLVLGARRGDELRRAAAACEEMAARALPFELDVPNGVAPSGREVHWSLHAFVDINWASDVDVDLPITVRNHDLERIRDAMGALDYRFSEWTNKPHAQRFDAEFQPPGQHRNRINAIKMGVEYLGATVKLMMDIDKKGRDKEEAVAIDLGQFRDTGPDVLAATLDKIIKDAMVVRYTKGLSPVR